MTKLMFIVAYLLTAMACVLFAIHNWIGAIGIGLFILNGRRIGLVGAILEEFTSK